MVEAHDLRPTVTGRERGRFVSTQPGGQVEDLILALLRTVKLHPGSGAGQANPVFAVGFAINARVPAKLEMTVKHGQVRAPPVFVELVIFEPQDGTVGDEWLAAAFNVPYRKHRDGIDAGNLCQPIDQSADPIVGPRQRTQGAAWQRRGKRPGRA